MQIKKLAVSAAVVAALSIADRATRERQAIGSLCAYFKRLHDSANQEAQDGN